MFCPNCGFENPPKANYCTNCGYSLSEEARGERAVRSRTVLLRILLGCIALALVCVILLLLFRNPFAAPAAPAASPAETAGESPAPAPVSPSPSPDTDLVVISPATEAPATSSPSPVPVTPGPSPSPVPEGTAVALEGDLLYRVNIFLSNFSEQGAKSFNSSTVADDYIIRLVEIYCKINHNACIHYENGEECLSLADANLYLERFFGRTVHPYDGAEYLLDAWHSFRYSDGCFRFPAADGESYNKFTVAYEMNANQDGTYTVQFQVYELGLEEYWNTPGVDDSFYRINNDQAGDMVWDYRILPVQGGTAVLRDYNFNGRATYQILSYEVWDIEFHY